MIRFLIYAAIFVIAFILGGISTILTTIPCGTLVIDETAEKDILRFQFDVPPEDIMKNRVKAIVTMKIEKIRK